MNEQTTIEKMRNLRLKSMAELYSRSLKENLYRDYTNDEFLALMLDTEWENRQHDKINNMISRGGFKENASVTNIDYQSKRGLDKNAFERLISLGFVTKKENLIITGPTGVGKSYLAQSIGIKACQMLYKTLYFPVGRFFDKAKLARIDGSYLKWIGNINKAELLILDDFGTAPIDQQSRNLLMDVIDNRYESSSIILTSQIPVSGWHALIGEATIADAILDRLVYSSHRIELEGESLRKKKKLST